jgi:hypothetical protein
VGSPGAFVTAAAIAWRVEDEIDLDTGLPGLGIVFAEGEEDKERKCDKERCDVGRLCCVQPET